MRPPVDVERLAHAIHDSHGWRVRSEPCRWLSCREPHREWCVHLAQRYAKAYNGDLTLADIAANARAYRGSAVTV